MNQLKQYRIRRGIRVALIVTVCVLGVLIAALGVLFGINRFSLSVELKGDREVEIGYGEVYTDPGTQVLLRIPILSIGNSSGC